MIEIRMMFDREGVKDAIGTVYTFLEEHGETPVEVTVRQVKE